MKVYQKPAMLVLSISANDMLCGNCTAKTRIDKDLNSALQAFFNVKGGWTDENGDGIVGDGETNLFDDTASCGSYYEGYCKFTGAENGLQQLFTS